MKHSRHYLLAISFIMLCLSLDALAAPRQGFMLETSTMNIEKTRQNIGTIADLGGHLVRFPMYFSQNPDIGFWVSYANQAYAVANSRAVNMAIEIHHHSVNTKYPTDASIQDFVSKWSTISAFFGAKTDRRISIWYELLNEPAITSTATWKSIALAAAKEIRKRDPNTAIVFSPIGSTTAYASNINFTPLVGIGNQVVTFHFWDWFNTLQSPVDVPLNSGNYVSAKYRYVGSSGSASSTSSTNYTLAQLRKKLDNVRDFGLRHNVPVYIGEVGIYQGHRDAARFLKDFTNECASRNIHLTIHAYREADVWNYEFNSSAWSVLTSWLAK